MKYSHSKDREILIVRVVNLESRQATEAIVGRRRPEGRARGQWHTKATDPPIHRHIKRCVYPVALQRQRHVHAIGYLDRHHDADLVEIRGVAIFVYGVRPRAKQAVKRQACIGLVERLKPIHKADVAIVFAAIIGAPDEHARLARIVERVTDHEVAGPGACIDPVVTIHKRREQEANGDDIAKLIGHIEGIVERVAPADRPMSRPTTSNAGMRTVRLRGHGAAPVRSHQKCKRLYRGRHGDRRLLESRAECSMNFARKAPG